MLPEICARARRFRLPGPSHAWPPSPHGSGSPESMVASFGGRLFAAVARLTPYYLPDEYIYPSLARSLAEQRPAADPRRGVHFPALLDPIVTAPVWLVTNDPVTAFRLTQGIHAVFFSLAAIPAYLLCRRLGLATVARPRSSRRSLSQCRTASTPRRCSPTRSRIRSCCRRSTPEFASSRSRRLRAQLAFAVFSCARQSSRASSTSSSRLQSSARSRRRPLPPRAGRASPLALARRC